MDKEFRMVQTIASNAPTIETLYTPYLYRQYLTLVVGDPGVCKTTLGYALSMAISEGKEFLGVKPLRPIKTLLLDFESGDGLIKQKYDEIGDGESYYNLQIYNGYEGYSSIKDKVKELYNEFQFEFILIDNLGSAFSIRDENDNAEAIKRLKALREDTKRYNSAVLIYHHPSKANMTGTRKGSGAFAWARYADIHINLNALGVEGSPYADDPDCRDIIEIEIAKHRISGNEQTKFFRKIGYSHFENCEPPKDYKYLKSYTTLIDKAIIAICDRKGNFQRKDIVSHVMNQINCSDLTVDTALKRLVTEGIIRKTEIYGEYQVS